jgi:hypothetical protein
MLWRKRDPDEPPPMRPPPDKELWAIVIGGMVVVIIVAIAVWIAITPPRYTGPLPETRSAQ